MHTVEVVEDAATAAVALDPLRSRLLALLAAKPASAAALAPLIGTTRQKVRYHLRALADRGLVREVDQRRHGGLTERIYAASASSYVVSPGALGDAGTDPARVSDRLSSAFAVAVAARAVRELGALTAGAADADRPLATLSIDAEIAFRTADDRAACADELRAAVLALVARYHHDGGRSHRIVAIAHPTPPPPPPQEP